MRRLQVMPVMGVESFDRQGTRNEVYSTMDLDYNWGIGLGQAMCCSTRGCAVP